MVVHGDVPGIFYMFSRPVPEKVLLGKRWLNLFHTNLYGYFHVVGLAFSGVPFSNLSPVSQCDPGHKNTCAG